MSVAPNKHPNYLVTALCVLVAGVFWLMNALNKSDYTIKMPYLLHFAYNDTLYVPTSPLPKQIMVNVSGRGWSLLRKQLSLDPQPIVYTITKPLKTHRISTSSLMDLIAEQIKDVRVNHIIADTLDINFDKKTTKTVRILVDSTGVQLKKPFIISSTINISPKNIVFQGPLSVLKNWENTLTVHISRQKIDSDFDEEITINYPENSSLKANTEKVRVSFEVSEWLGTGEPRSLTVSKRNK